MCDKCFNKEELFFQSNEEFSDFDLLLSKKLKNENGVIFGRFIKTSEIQVDSRDFEDSGIYLYKCANCGQFWALEEFKRFYKINIENIEVLLVEKDSNRQKKIFFWRFFSAVLILLILLTILYGVINN